MLEEQLRRVEQRIDALLLVGGFSGSEYLYTRVNVSLIMSSRLILPSVCEYLRCIIGYSVGYSDAEKTEFAGIGPLSSAFSDSCGWRLHMQQLRCA